MQYDFNFVHIVQYKCETCVIIPTVKGLAFLTCDPINQEKISHFYSDNLNINAICKLRKKDCFMQHSDEMLIHDNLFNFNPSSENNVLKCRISNPVNESGCRFLLALCNNGFACILYKLNDFSCSLELFTSVTEKLVSELESRSFFEQFEMNPVEKYQRRIKMCRISDIRWTQRIENSQFLIWTVSCSGHLYVWLFSNDNGLSFLDALDYGNIEISYLDWIPTNKDQSGILIVCLFTGQMFMYRVDYNGSKFTMDVVVSRDDADGRPCMHGSAYKTSDDELNVLLLKQSTLISYRWNVTKLDVAPNLQTYFHSFGVLRGLCTNNITGHTFLFDMHSDVFMLEFKLGKLCLNPIPLLDKNKPKSIIKDMILSSNGMSLYILQSNSTGFHRRKENDSTVNPFIF
ncbi:hypothetical protein GJ496_000578 [Pomphorhynchus laevis]|nr:hypothetical protein GJ496_000578 [Pomphorhynchus laevis]